MNNKKLINNMSLSVDLEIQDRLKKIAKRRNVSVSKLVRDIVDKHLGPDVEDGTVIDTIILKIPAEMKYNSGNLKQWLQARFDNIVLHLTNGYNHGEASASNSVSE